MFAEAVTITLCPEQIDTFVGLNVNVGKGVIVNNTLSFTVVVAVPHAFEMVTYNLMVPFSNAPGVYVVVKEFVGAKVPVAPAPKLQLTDVYAPEVAAVKF